MIHLYFTSDMYYLAVVICSHYSHKVLFCPLLGNYNPQIKFDQIRTSVYLYYIFCTQWIYLHATVFVFTLFSAVHLREALELDPTNFKVGEVRESTGERGRPWSQECQAYARGAAACDLLEEHEVASWRCELYIFSSSHVWNRWKMCESLESERTWLLDWRFLLFRIYLRCFVPFVVPAWHELPATKAAKEFRQHQARCQAAAEAWSHVGRVKDLGKTTVGFWKCHIISGFFPIFFSGIQLIYW